MTNRDAEDGVPDRPPAPPEAWPRTAVYLHPGQVVVAHEASAVTTILGSCVAVCLWDSERRVGGVNHFLLPYFAAGGAASSPRFGNVAVAQLVEGIVALGVRRQGLQAKVFGGACVIDAFHGRGEHLGTKNVEVALALLKREEIPVVAEDVGGRRGRKVIFHTDSGVALVKLI